jgi:sugar lactone lactonase YvrE
VSPAGLAFDGSGALWVANLFGASTVKYSPAQLASSGSPTPAVKISANAGSLQGPLGLAFDRHGHLWVAAAFGQRVVRYHADQLLASGTPVPSVTVTGFAQAKAIAFDHAGDLWVNAILAPADRSLVRIADPDSLPATSAVTVATAVGFGADTDGGFPAFFPAPPDLPIRTP